MSKRSAMLLELVKGIIGKEIYICNLYLTITVITILPFFVYITWIMLLSPCSSLILEEHIMNYFIIKLDSTFSLLSFYSI